jgi:hypothetical protein
MRNKSLTSVDLEENLITQKGVIVLFSLIGVRRTEEKRFSESRCFLFVFPPSSLFDNPTLPPPANHLNFKQHAFQFSAGAQALGAAISRHKSIEYLNISNNSILAQGCALSVHLTSFSFLEPCSFGIVVFLWNYSSVFLFAGCNNLSSSYLSYLSTYSPSS